MNPTLLELIAYVADVTEDEREIVAVIADILSSGSVRLATHLPRSVPATQVVESDWLLRA